MEKRPLRILHVCKMTGIAGTENHLLALLPALKAGGVAPHLLILVEPATPMTTYIAAMQALGIPCESLPIRGDFDPSVVTALRRKFAGFEAIHTHLIHADVHGLFANLFTRLPHFCSGHNDDQFRLKPYYRLFHALFWRSVTAGIAISEAVRQFMIQIEFAPPPKIVTVRYGYDPSAVEDAGALRATLRADLGLAAETPLIGSVCRLIEQKGLPNALNALALIKDQTSAHYVVIGDGPLRAALMEQAQALGLADRVHWLGWRADARTYYAAFDLFLMPSLWEGFGLVLLEAMAASLPVVASRISALPEIVVEGETGFLVPPADPNAIAAALLKLLNDPAAARRLGEQGRLRVEREFSVAKMSAGTLAVYRRAGRG